MKKTFLWAAAALSLALTGCGGGDSSDASAPPTEKIMNTEQAENFSTFLDLAASGKHLYAASGFESLRIFDVSNLSSPAAAGAISTRIGTPSGSASDQIYSVAARPGVLAAGLYPACPYFCFPNNGEIRLYDVSHPATPVLKSAWAARATDLLMDGSHLYVLRNDVISFHPLETAPSSAAPLLTMTPIIFPGNSFGELDIYDVSNIANPVLVGSVTVPAGGRMVKMDKRLYVGFSDMGGSSRGFRSYDVTDPAHPALLKSHGTNSSDSNSDTVRLAVAGNALYLLTPGKDVQVFDTSAATPQGTALDVGGTPQSLAQRGGRLYVTRASAEQRTLGVAVFDIGTPLQPKRLPDLFTDAAARDIRLFDGFGLLVMPEIRETLPAGGWTVKQAERFGLFATR